MRVVVDTNVFLDVLLARLPWVQDSQSVLDWCDLLPGSGWIAWHTLSNIYYVGRRIVGARRSLKQIDAILAVFEVCPADSNIAGCARQLALGDFEDALQAAAAQAAKADWIVTRNKSDFRGSPIAVLTPAEFTRLVSP